MSDPPSFPVRPDLDRLFAFREELVTLRRAPNTQRCYRNDWTSFDRWCRQAGLNALPATEQSIVLYLTDLLLHGYKISTARHHYAAIHAAHRAANIPFANTYQVRILLDGATRARREQPAMKAPLHLEHLRAICFQLRGNAPYIVRNRALLILGFTSALRGANLVDLHIADLNFAERGLIVHVRHEKQDQKGTGRLIGIPRAKDLGICPILAMEHWLALRGTDPGPVFTRVTTHRPASQPLGPRRVAEIVKQAVESIGLTANDYAAHSLRAGFITCAVEEGVGEFVIAKHTGHRSLSSLRRYFRSKDPFRANACIALGI